MKNRFFFIDMVCLFDRTYAGIANVNYQIVKYFYQHHKESTYFFHQDQIVRPEVIEVLLRRRDGLGLQEFSQTGRMYVQPLNDLLRQIKGRTVGIYPYLKSFHEKFDYEIQVIYDLTILLTPEFHHPETIKTHIPAWERGVRTNHLCMCISHSTQEDLIQYIGLPKEKTLVSHLGCEPELRNDPVYKNLLQEFKDRVEKFILVLGTVEPRKNIQSILTFLEGNPGVLNQHKFLFIGRDGGKDGWGETFREKLMKLRIDENVKSQKIVFLEYVSEEEKNILLMTAEFLIYPSIYEGFGLPVLEALNLGCPVLASMSSSIPEVGEKAIDYFDPYDAKSFEESFHRIVGRLEEDRGNVVRQCIHQASQFTWNKFFDRILRRVDQDLGETQQISTASQPVFLKMPRPLKVVVLKLDHRGDFLFSIPAIMKLKDKLKYVDLDIVVGEWNVDLAKKLNVFRNIYPFNFYHSFGSTLSESTKTKAQKEKELLNQLSPYDLAIDFRRPGETRFLLATVPADLKVGYKSFSEYDQALDICLDTEIDQPGVWIEDNQRNVSLQLLKLVDAIPFHGVYLPSLAPYQPEGRQIGMFPGAGEESRQWPVEFFAKVAQKSIGLRMAEKINVYLAPHEQKLAEPFSALPQTKIFIGLELDEMLKSLTRNRFVLTNNSFGAHICSYLGIPSMAIYSGVETTREWAPPFGSITVVYSDLSCVPCHGLAEHCPDQLICLKQIKPEYILDLMKERMKEKIESNRSEHYLYCPDLDRSTKVLRFIENFSKAGKG